jgi:hypothetical protein
MPPSGSREAVAGLPKVAAPACAFGYVSHNFLISFESQSEKLFIPIETITKKVYIAATLRAMGHKTENSI